MMLHLEDNEDAKLVQFLTALDLWLIHKSSEQALTTFHSLTAVLH